MLLTAPVLAYYSARRPTVISTDASSTGIGAVLFQVQDDGGRRPVFYISRSLNETEKQYAVIEKEALAAVWACEKLSDYVLGLSFKLETDHKPLVPLLTSKNLSDLPPRILRFRLRMMRFSADVIHVPGKYQSTADAFSRAPSSTACSRQEEFEMQELESSVSAVVSSLDTTPTRLEEIRVRQKEDSVINRVRDFCVHGWPADNPDSLGLQQFWDNRQHFSVVDDLLLYDDRLVIPQSMREFVLNRLHAGHLGITKCTARAQQVVWWPNITSDIRQKVSRCDVCLKARPEQKEPLVPTPFPDRPWSRVGVDLMEIKGHCYVVAVDYFSRWAELRLLDHGLSSDQVILRLKAIFAIHGIPEVLVSDNAQQFLSYLFKAFAREYDFTHVTSSPKHPQGNGEVERAIRTLKSLVKTNDDIYLALLAYRSAPLQLHGQSPSQLLMGRQLRTCLPVPPSSLLPHGLDIPTLQQREEIYRAAQTANFDRRHRARVLPPLAVDDRVWVRDVDRLGTVLQYTDNPRSFIVKTEKGTIRRNRAGLVLLPPTPSGSSS